MQHHTQNPPGFGPWGFDSPPGTNAKSRIKHCTLLNVLRARLQILPSLDYSRRL